MKGYEVNQDKKQIIKTNKNNNFASNIIIAEIN